MKFFRIIFSIVVVSILLNACRKEYSIENGPASSGSWEFMNGSTKYSGLMDSVVQARAGSVNELSLIGSTKDGGQVFQLYLFADSFKVGTYKASAFQSSFNYSTLAKTIYNADQLTGEFVVTISAIDDQQVEGTFSGEAEDSTGTLVQLSNGKFKASFAQGSVNPPSSGVLGDSAGNCKPVVIQGAFAGGIPTTEAESVQIQVTVTVPGPYSITTDPLNGITFSGSGNFATTGTQTVLLHAAGTPVLPGSYDFVMHYGSSQCSFKLEVLGEGAGDIGTGNACSSFSFAGTYQQGITFNSGNTVTVQVNVTTPGSYHISSDSLNGVRFSGAGIFSASGVQQVTLTGSGTPVNSGVENFSITYGSGSCGFPLTIISGGTPSDDYFPLSVNSRWTYFLDGGTSQDSLFSKVIDYSATLGGAGYQGIGRYALPDSLTALDTSYYRKPGGDYYEYINFTNLFGFDQYVGSEFIFLKDNVGVSQTWNSPEVSGTIGGIPISGYAKMTILEKGVQVTSLPGFNFEDVIKVKYEYYLTMIPTPVLTEERWFAKNIGEIYFSTNNGVTNNVYKVSRYRIAN